VIFKFARSIAGKIAPAQGRLAGAANAKKPNLGIGQLEEDAIAPATASLE
jgi:hypothetical protein